MRLRTALWLILLIIVVLISFLLTKEVWLTKASNFLVTKDELKPADVIFCLGGGRDDVVVYTVNLYNQKFAPKVAFSGEAPRVVYINTPWAELAKKLAVKLGCPATAIILSPKPTSTYEEALFAKHLMRKNNFKSAIIVTDPCHMRRTKYTFLKAFSASGESESDKKNDYIKLYFTYPDHSWFLADSWWLDEDSTIAVVNEYVKLIWYYLTQKI